MNSHRDCRPTVGSARSLWLIGDDVSGSTEALAAALSARPASTRPAGWVHLRAPSSAHFAQNGAWQALDLDVRQAPPDIARSRYRQALRLLGTDATRVTALKIDSLLRGNVAAAFAEVEPGPGRPVVFAPALPAQGRSTVAGQVVLDDADAAPGALEQARTDAVAATGRPAASISLDVLRDDFSRLVSRVGEHADHGVVAVCDAETDEDLDLVAAAALAHPAPIVVGAAGVVAAIARRLSPELHPAQVNDNCPGQRPPSRVLVVVGTAEPRAGEQVDLLAEHGLPVASLSLDDTESGLVGIHNALATGAAVLRAPESMRDPSRSAPILTTLVDVACRAVSGHPDMGLVLTGGATARAVLDRLGVSSLRLCCQVHPGAAHLTTEGGRAVVIRPGSHGAADSLVQLVNHLGGLPDTASRPRAPRSAAPISMEGQL